MKVVFVTKDELNELWDMMHPQCRFDIGGGAGSGAVLRITDTLAVVDAEVVTFEQAREDARSANAEINRRREVRRSEEGKHET